MRFRDTLGLNATPLVLRLALGVVFVWAGSSKLLHSDPFPGERGARLAELGIIPKPASAGVVIPIVPEANPESDVEPEVEEPAKPPVTEPVKEPKEPEGPEVPGVDPNQPDPAPETAGNSGPIARAGPMMVILPARLQSSAASGSDADKPPRLRRLYNLVLDLDSASKPNAQGYVLWPKFLATAAWMERMAWAASLTQFIGGILVLLGLLTRPAAFGILCTMLTALWLTQIGPSIGAPGSFLGFLPDPEMADPTKCNTSTSGWLMMLWEFTLGCVALGLVLSGAGRVSMDSLIFRRENDPAPRKFERPAEQPPKRPV